MQKQSNSAELAALLFGERTQLINLKCFLGSRSGVSQEQIQAELCSAIKQRADGRATISATFGDTAKKVDARAWVASLRA